MKKQSKRVQNRLRNRAIKLSGLGYAVIPLYGDARAAEPKKPTIKWRAFQKRIPGRRELALMFDSRAGAIGVVCGRVSQLLVIDFDDHLRYRRFCRHLPQYAETYTVKTRRGYHLYFRTGVKVPSHQVDGGDIKGEKSYVVASPSVIGGFEYKEVNGGEPTTLNPEAVDRILNHFHSRSGERVPRDGGRQLPGSVDIASMYERLSVDIGRNNALFRCASVGRRQGMSCAEVEKLLLRRHALAPGPAMHKVEQFIERDTEGRRTIASAFRGSAGSLSDGEAIPNSVRERLLQTQGSSVTARLLDIMFLAGWRAESWFRMGDAVALCGKYGLERKSVIAALTGDHCSFNGRHIISRRYVEYLDVWGLNTGKRGRPVQLVFQVPSVLRLLELLGVGWSPSDSLDEKDVCSRVAYRRALHREYVKRVSPQLPMSILARRLGVNARTLRRYNAELGVKVSERVGRFELSWDRLKCLPRRGRNQSKNETPGYWLEVGGTARFPAWRHIGAALLRSGGHAVHVCVRRASELSLGKRSVLPLVYEAISTEAFMRLRLWRGEGIAGDSVFDRLRGLVNRAVFGVGRLRYERIWLRYDSVAAHIADDKVAESIPGYLYAKTYTGAEVRRPALRGVAYRMLKEFGEGNVCLAVRDSVGEVLSAMAHHALRVGDGGAGASLLARSMS